MLTREFKKKRKSGGPTFPIGGEGFGGGGGRLSSCQPRTGAGNATSSKAHGRRGSLMERERRRKNKIALEKENQKIKKLEGVQLGDFTCVV